MLALPRGSRLICPLGKLTRLFRVLLPRTQPIVTRSLVTLCPSNIAQILPEAKVRILHRLEMLELKIHRLALVDLGRVGLFIIRLGFKLGQRESRLAQIADLTSIPSRATMLTVVLLGEVLDGGGVEDDLAVLLLEALLGEVEVELEDVDGLFFVKLGVVEAHVDSGCKGFVKIANTVGGQEQDSCIVFQYSQKYCRFHPIRF